MCTDTPIQSHPFSYTHSVTPIQSHPFSHTHSVTPIQSRPFSHTHSVTPIQSHPFSHTHSVTPIQSHPFSHAHSVTPIQSHPFSHSHSVTPIQSLPFSHSLSGHPSSAQTESLLLHLHDLVHMVQCISYSVPKLSRWAAGRVMFLPLSPLWDLHVCPQIRSEGAFSAWWSLLTLLAGEGGEVGRAGEAH